MKIILNADDFGYSQETVDATIDCFERGFLTSATIMAHMPGTDAAVAFAREHPQFSFGVHLTFVGDGRERPLCPPSAVRTLVKGDGSFRGSRAVRLLAMTHRLPVVEIEREIAAQIEVVRNAGVGITHVDSHRHLHKFRSFREALACVLPRYGLDRVRNVQDVYLQRPLRSPTYWLGRAWRRRLMTAFATTDHFYMPATAHDPDWHRIALFLDRLPGEIIEVGLHPGLGNDWRGREAASLAAFNQALIPLEHVPVGWDAVSVMREEPPPDGVET